MNTIYYPRTHNFSVTPEGHLVCDSKDAFTFIFFYTNNCPHCGPVKPVFGQASQQLTGCRFGVVNVDEERELLYMAQNTTTPIKYVPMLILYYKGYPYQLFTQIPTLDNITNFIRTAASRLQGNNQGGGVQENSAAGGAYRPGSSASQPPQPPAIPPYTVGKPYCDDEHGVCYLTFDNAYKNAAPTQPQQPQHQPYQQGQYQPGYGNGGGRGDPGRYPPSAPGGGW